MEVKFAEGQSSIVDAQQTMPLTPRNDVTHSSSSNRQQPPIGVRYIVGIAVLVIGLVTILCLIIPGKNVPQAWPLEEHHELEIGQRTTFSSPGYPGALPGNNMTYVRRFSTRNANYIIRLEFTLFRIGGSSSLTIADFYSTSNTSSVLASFRNGDHPTIVYSSSNEVLVTFYVSSQDFNPGFSTEVSVRRLGARPPIQCDKASEWACLDGVTCILQSARCDSERDCPYGEDEQACDLCGYGHFHCDNGSCIPDYQICDGRLNCHEGNDEEKCEFPGPCPSDFFTCGDGTCIRRDKTCNYYWGDCSDKSDESPELCGTCDLPGAFKCSDGSCIPVHRRCNGHAECTDNEDEMNCAEFFGKQEDYIELEPHDVVSITSPNWPQPYEPRAYAAWNIRAPAGNSFHIEFTHCVLDYLTLLLIFDMHLDVGRICHYDNNCTGQSLTVSSNDISIFFYGGPLGGTSGCLVSVTADDTPGCDSFTLSCTVGQGTENKTCIGEWQLCDSYDDCPDGEDERNCTETSGEWSRLRPERENYFCQNSTITLERYRVCDYAVDCPLLDDEINCPCRDTDFRCNSGVCIPSPAVCNFFYECPGGKEDEYNCGDDGNTFTYALDAFLPINITSPNQPENYEAPGYAEYHVTAPPNHTIIVYFDDVMIDESSEIAFIDGDDVTDRGATFGLFSKNDHNLNTLFSKSNVMTIVFYGGPFRSARGIRMELHAVEDS